MIALKSEAVANALLHSRLMNWIALKSEALANALLHRRPLIMIALKSEAVVNALLHSRLMNWITVKSEAVAVMRTIEHVAVILRCCLFEAVISRSILPMREAVV